LGRLLARQRAERKRRLKANMKSSASVLMILAFAVVSAGGAERGVQAAEDLQRAAGVAANSNLMRAAVPQLSASPGVVTGAVMVEEPARPPAPPSDRVAHTTTGSLERRRTVLMVVLVLAVVGSSYFLQRQRSKSDPS
jgi:hypothetical protein